MKTQRIIRRAFAAIITLTSFALPASGASASAQDKLITNFRFDTFDTSAKIFDRQLVTSAAQEIRSYLDAKSDSRRFVFKGYTDVRCNPAEFKKRYPRLKHLDVCAVRADKTTLGNWTLSMERALTLRDQVLDRLSADEVSKVKFEIEGFGEAKATAKLADCRRSEDSSPCSDDRRATIYLRRIYTPETPPQAVGDSPLFGFSDTFSFDVSGNDSCLVASCSWALVSQPTTGSVNMSSNGLTTYTPPSADFSGTASFQYRVSDGKFAATALVTITILPPETVVPPLVDKAIELAAPVWARLGVAEKFSLSVRQTCAGAVVVDNRCEVRQGNAGAFVEVKSATLTNVAITPPRGYSPSRFSINSPAIGSLIAPNAPISGTAKFSQATQANQPFKLVVGVYIELVKVRYHLDRNNAQVRDSEETTYSFTSVTSDIGVVGNVAR